MADNLHGSRRIHPCPPEIRAGRMAEIMDSQIRHSSPTTCSLESCADSLDRFIFIQEHAIRV